MSLRASDIVFIPAIPVLVSLVFLFLKSKPKYLPHMMAATMLTYLDFRYKDICYVSYRGPSRGYSIGIPDIFTWGILLYIMFGAPKERKKVWWLPTGLLFILIFDFWGLFASLAAFNKQFALFMVFKLFKATLLFWTMFNALTNEKRLRFLCLAASIGLIYLGGLVLYHKYVVHKHVIRAQGPFSHPNTLVMMTNLLLPIAFAQLMRAKDNLTLIIHSMATYCGAICVIFTKSRGGLAMMALHFFIVIVISLWNRITAQKAIVLVLFMIGALITSIFAAPRLIARFQNADPSSKEARVRFNNAAKHMARDHFFGIGLNNYPFVLGTTLYYYDVYPEFVDEWKPIGEETSRLGVCHHVYYLVVAELGYVGLALFILMITYQAIFTIPLAFFPKKPNSIANVIGIGAGAGLLTLHGQGLLEWAWFQSELMHVYFIVTAMIVAARRLEKP